MPASLIVGRLDTNCSRAFSLNDISDLDGFLKDLTDTGDPVSKYLWGHMTSRLQDQAQDAFLNQAQRAESLRQNIADAIGFMYSHDTKLIISSTNGVDVTSIPSELFVTAKTNPGDADTLTRLLLVAGLPESLTPFWNTFSTNNIIDIATLAEELEPPKNSVATLLDERLLERDAANQDLPRATR